MQNKVDANKNEHPYNPEQPYVQRPENLPKNKRKRHQRGGSK